VRAFVGHGLVAVVYEDGMEEIGTGSKRCSDIEGRGRSMQTGWFPVEAPADDRSPPRSAPAPWRPQPAVLMYWVDLGSAPSIPRRAHHRDARSRSVTVMSLASYPHGRALRQQTIGRHDALRLLGDPGRRPSPPRLRRWGRRGFVAALERVNSTSSSRAMGSALIRYLATWRRLRLSSKTFAHRP
jgi:hypothetical protein